MRGTIAPHVLEQAAEWLVQLHDPGCSDDVRAGVRDACAHWCAQHPEHARAWERAERLTGKLGALPPQLSRSVLESTSRRGAVLRVVALLAAVPVPWGVWQLAQSRQWTADVATAPGEQRAVTLADGSRVTLNTGSAIDVRFGAATRLIVLRRGEMLIDSGEDAAGRPLCAGTEHGQMAALGTRFTVRRHDDCTDVAVLEGAVSVEPLRGSPLVVHAGQQTRFTAEAVAAAVPHDPAVSAWIHGMLLADAMRLDTLAAELARYRPGIVRVEPSIAALTVSGAFPVRDMERTLAMLAQTHRLDIHRRWNGWWITLAPRA